MRIGNLDRQLVILRDVEIGRDNFNQPIFELRQVSTVWAQKIHKAEDERFAAEQRYAVRTVTFRTYWFDGLQPTDKLRCDGDTYDVKGVRELGFREGIEIAAEWQE